MRAAPGRALRAFDPAEEVALVARARRELLLRVHRHRLRREDLEDCYSQATLELVKRARNGGAFSSRAHVANAIEQRFLSRIHDRRRALGGRSPMLAALENAMSLTEAQESAVEIVDVRADLEELVMLRLDLRRLGSLAQELTPDQRLALGSQIGGSGCAEFCERFGWSAEKYRKVAQRARSRLRALMSSEGRDVPAVAGPSEEGEEGPCL